MNKPHQLRPGDRHPRAYVGPPEQYDFMGATQFCLLASLGLRESHTVLDFGCGSLRAGRLLMPYLKPGNYFGVEPNKWLIKQVVRQELGRGFLKAFKPTFNHNAEFKFDVFDRRFDFIVLQSIFSHTGADLLQQGLNNAQAAMDEKSRLLVTVIHPNDDKRHPRGENLYGWQYPGCVSYEKSYFSNLAESQGYYTQELPWFHPRQTWWLLTLSQTGLLPTEHLSHLQGIALQDQE